MKMRQFCGVSFDKYLSVRPGCGWCTTRSDMGPAGALAPPQHLHAIRQERKAHVKPAEMGHRQTECFLRIFLVYVIYVVVKEIHTAIQSPPHHKQTKTQTNEQSKKKQMQSALPNQAKLNQADGQTNLRVEAAMGKKSAPHLEVF